MKTTIVSTPNATAVMTPALPNSSVTAGSRVVSVRTVPSGRWTYYAPAVYTAVPRKADGVLTWRCTEKAPCGWIPNRNGTKAPAGYRSEAKAYDFAHDIATERGIDCAVGVRHGQPVTQ